MEIGERAALAAQLKESGACNCAQAVAAALADQTGLPVRTLKQATAGFCAGMGTMEATCGALIGAGFVAGLATQGAGTLRCTRQLIGAFKAACGATVCRELKTPVNGAPLCPCDVCVKNAVLAYGEAVGLREPGA